jgi:hypothetical protein
VSASFDLDALVEEAALELVHKHNLDEIVASLQSSGVTLDAARRLVLIVPSAFARERFEPEGIQFPDHFLVGPLGAAVERPNESEPFYATARKLARRWLAESGPSLVGRVLDWSAEADAIKKAHEQGLTPVRMGFVHHHDFPTDFSRSGQSASEVFERISLVERIARGFRGMFSRK